MLSGMTFDEDSFMWRIDTNPSDFITADLGDSIVPPVETIIPNQAKPVKRDDESWQPKDEDEDQDDDEDENSEVNNHGRKGKRSRLNNHGQYDSTGSEILALQMLIAKTRKKQATCQITDPKKKRAAMNKLSALISRTSKRIDQLFKVQEIEELKAQLNQLMGQNTLLSKELNNLKSEYHVLQAKFAHLHSKLAEAPQKSDVDLSLELPSSTMFVKYQSPTTSPRKPKDLQTMDRHSVVRTKLTDTL